MDNKAWELLLKRFDTLEDDIKEIRSDVKDTKREIFGLKGRVAMVAASIGSGVVLTGKSVIEFFKG